MKLPSSADSQAAIRPLRTINKKSIFYTNMFNLLSVSIIFSSFLAALDNFKILSSLNSITNNKKC